ncbi:8-hydroxyquercetin 8-O-methyltransferase [Morus notabilis]|uniref:8-hydroxyquercetin 8-O-methyltransferase n=1 Tax=Morus notabilis TaxID=981085 RepID=W9R4B1_9ROSA|nr:8-hydroxyquercetin 8-O-methyltransferase [Morus notabilis]
MKSPWNYLSDAKRQLQVKAKLKVIIVDMVVLDNQKNKDIDHDHDHDDQLYETQVFFDMLMMVLLPGREMKEKEWAKLFSDAGLTTYKITRILGV